MSIYIGLDIGGTKLIAVSANSHGDIRSRITKQTPVKLEDGLALIGKMIEKASDEEEIERIGVAIGGPVDYKSGIVSPLHQPEWNDVPLKEILTEKYNCEVSVDVDTNIGAIAESKCLGRTDQKLLYITLSTGLGGGFIVNGKIYRGINGAHPEIGHQSINYKTSSTVDIECECGAPDCLEAFVSGNGIKKLYGKPAEDISEEQWDEVAYNLGQGLRNLATIYTPDIIILGGGIIHHQGEKLISKARNYMHENLKLVPMPKIRISRFGYDTALIGSIIVAVEGLEKF